MFGPNHELAHAREQEIEHRLRTRRGLSDLPSAMRTGEIRGSRRRDGSLWLFRLPRRATA
jgi:hypothetical protein